MKIPPGLSEQERVEWLEHYEEAMADAEEIGAEIQAGRKRLDIIVDLLAWVLARQSAPTDLSSPDNWPGLDLTHDPLVFELALSDKLLFDLARNQVACRLKLNPIVYAPFASRLLLKPEPPLKRTWASDFLARDFLIVAACAVAEEFGFWPAAVPPPSAKPEDRLLSEDLKFEAAGRFGYSANGSAKALFNLLNGHHRLSDLPDAVPSVDTLRAALAKRVEVCGALGIAWKGAAELLSDSVHRG